MTLREHAVSLVETAVIVVMSACWAATAVATQPVDRMHCESVKRVEPTIA